MSASITAASETSAKWWPLATICVPTSTARSAAANRLSVAAGSPGFSIAVRVEPEALELGNVRLQLALEPLRPGSDSRELDRAAGGAGLGRRLRVPAVVAMQHLVSVQDERDVAVRAAPRLAAGPAMQRGATPRRLSRRIALPPPSATLPSSASSGADSG